MVSQHLYQVKNISFQHIYLTQSAGLLLCYPQYTVLVDHSMILILKNIDTYIMVVIGRQQMIQTKVHSCILYGNSTQCDRRAALDSQQHDGNQVINQIGSTHLKCNVGLAAPQQQEVPPPPRVIFGVRRRQSDSRKNAGLIIVSACRFSPQETLPTLEC